MKKICLDIIEKVVKFGLNNPMIMNIPQQPYWVIDDEISLDYEFLSNIDKVEELYEDEYSKKVFQWHLYSVLLQCLYKRIDLTNQMCDDPYTVKGECLDEFVSGLKKNENGEYTVNEYQIQTHKGLLKETWGARSYVLDSLFSLKEYENIIDGGAYKGETTIWFANEAPNGKVHAFEIQNEVQEVLYQNISINGLQDRVIIVQKGLWDNSTSQQVVLSDVTSNLGLSKGATSQNVQTISIDDYVDENQIKSVDYIKLDIEGAETKAIIGAQKTIKKDKPVLSIAMYHKLTDIYTIPLLIKSINSEYKFYLSKKMQGNGEIILFCL